jgi:hypothetical protein
MDSSRLQSSNGRSTKGSRQKRKSEVLTESPFEILCAAPEQINPAILLAEELMLKGMAASFDFTEIERAEEILISSREEIARVENQFTALVKTPPAPATLIPIGF